MALTPQHVQLLSEKLDTSRDDKTAPMGQVVEAQNCFRLKAGEYRRRLGRAAIATAAVPSGTLPTIWQLAAYKGGLVSLAKHSAAARMVWPYSDSAAKWTAPGTGANGEKFPIRTKQRGPIVSTRASIHSSDNAAPNVAPGWPDVAMISGTSYAVCVFQETVTSGTTPGAAFLVVIYDMTTGVALYRNYELGTNAHVDQVGAKVIITYTDGSNLKFQEWTSATALTGSPTAGSNFVVTLPAAASRVIDTYSDGSYLYVAALTSTAATVQLVKYDPGASASILDVTLAEDADRALGWLANATGNGKIALAACGTTDGVSVTVMNTSFTTQAGSPLTMDSANADVKARTMNLTGWIVDTDATGNFVLAYGVGSGAGTGREYDCFTKVATRLSQSITSGTVWQRSVVPRSKAFHETSGEYYLLMSYMSPTQPMYGLMALASTALTASPIDRSFVTKVSMWTANAIFETRAPLTNCVSGNGGFVCAVPRAGLSVVAAGDNTSHSHSVKNGVDLVTFTVDPSATGRAFEAADQLIVPAGQVLEFDGVQLAECGFPMYPETIRAPAASGSGSSLSAGTYQYCHLFRYIDARGRVHRSAPSVPMSITVTAGQKVTLSPVGGVATSTNQIPTCRIFGRDATNPSTLDNITIELYRTTADKAVFYLLAEMPNVATADTTAALVDGTAGGSIATGTVDVSDANLAYGTLLYTSGTTLENHAPPQFTAACVHRGRVFGISADDESIWLSKPIADGLGLEFNNNLSFRVNDERGAPTALVSMDDKLILYKATGTYVVMGDGPDNLGRGSYPQAQRLPGNIGTTNARSVIATPNGAWSHSTKGIACLGRGLTMEDAGKPVQDWLTSGTTVVDVVHEPARSWIRFFLSTGNCLVFDYYFNEWYKFTNQTTIAAVLAGTTLYQASGTATVSADSTTVYTDDASAAYTMKVVLAWLATGGIKGFQRIWEEQILGTYVGAHDVCVDHSYDYVDTVIETCSRTGADPWDFAIKPMRQKCSALKLAIYDGTRATGTITCVAKASLINGETVTVSDGVNTATAFTWDTAGTGVDTAYVKYINVSSTDLTTAAHMATALADAMAAQKQTGVFRVSASPSSAVVTVTSDAAGTAGNVTITETVANAGFTVAGFTGGAHISTAGFRLSAWAMTAGVKSALDKMASSRKTAA